MLSKEICKCCMKSVYHADVFWDKLDESDWLLGYVYCPHKEHGLIRTSIYDEPPEQCQYQLEHIVSKGEYR